MTNANNLRSQLQNRHAQAQVSLIHAPEGFLHSMSAFIHTAEEGIGKLFPRSLGRKMSFPKIASMKRNKMVADKTLSLMMVFPRGEGSFNLPYNKRYIDSLSLQKILSIKTGNLLFKRAHFLSIFSNRRAVIFTGSGNSEAEAKFMADFWYREWRKDQKHKNIAVKILDKEYHSSQKSASFYFCELKINYSFNKFKD